MEERRHADRAVVALAAFATGIFYLWCAQAVNERFEWRHEQGGYYNWLGRALAGGHLYLPVEPSKELLALPDPWDPARNEAYRVQDLVLYHRRYYLYHGPSPAWLLFTPWRLITGHDLPEAFAAFLFCYLGYLCCVATLLRWLSYLKARPSPLLLVLALGALGVCNCAPFLLLRVSVYEVAISGGYFCLSAGFWLFVRGFFRSPASRISLAFSGLLLGLAAGCRPHLGVAAVFAGIALLSIVGRRGRREILSFLLPVAACALAIAGYNYARFHDPLEFGMRYEMASASYFRPRPAAVNLIPGLYYLLACPPSFEAVFPYVRLAWRLPFDSPGYPLPERYFLEMIAGACAIWPLALAIPFFWRRLPDRLTRRVAAVLVLSAAGCFLFIASLGLISHRYQADFVPLLVLAGCCLVCGAKATAAVRVCAAGVLLYAVVVNLAIGITGPYDEYVQTNPVAYVRLAGWLSPISQYRPQLNPQLTVDAAYEFPGEGPLISAGRFGSRYLLAAENAGEGKVRLVSSGAVTGGNRVAVEVTIQPGPNRVHLDYNPEKRQVVVEWNGLPAIRQTLPFLVTAPAQVRIGEDRAEIDPRPVKFSGRVTIIRSQIVASR